MSRGSLIVSASNYLSHLTRWLICKRSLGCDKDLAKARDARIGAMREVLMAVKVVKVFRFLTLAASSRADFHFYTAQCMGRSIIPHIYIAIMWLIDASYQNTIVVV